jgi:hypothetical protein
VSWIEEERARRESYWSARNEEMRLNEEVYLMTDATETAREDGDEKLYRNIGRVMIDKLSFMVGRQKHKIRVDARSDAKEFVEAAQECEDFLYEFNRQVDLEFSAVMNQGLGQTEAWYGACRGWLASRVWLDAASDFPFKASIFDPMHCYPQPGRKGAGQLIDMMYYEKADKFGFLSRNPAYADHDAIKDLDIDDEIEVTWYEDTTWSILLVDGEQVNEGHDKHEYGFCPWVMNPIGGPPMSARHGHTKYGAGVLGPLRPTLAYINRLYSQVATEVARMGNPPSKDFYDSRLGGTAPEALSVKPGARNRRDRGVGQDSEVLTVGARPDQAALMVDATNLDVQRGGVLNVLYGDATGMSGGFHQSVAINAAEDNLFPLTNGVILHRQWRNRLALNLVLVQREGGLEKPAVQSDQDDERQRPRPGTLYRRPNRSPGARSKIRPAGGRFVYDVLEAKSVELAGVENEVELHRMTPQDTLQMLQAAAIALDRKLLSLDYIRDRFLGVDDPIAMNHEVIADLILADEDIMKEYLLPLVLRGIDPDLYSHYEFRRQKKEFEEQQAQMMGGMNGGAPPGLPPGMNGGPPPGAFPPEAPLPGMGLPAEIMPAPMQPFTGQPGQMDEAALAAYLQSLPQQGGF